MRILVLDEEFPYPLNSGKRIRTYNLFQRLANRHEIGYLAYGHEESDSAQALNDVGIRPIAVEPQVPEKSGLRFYLRLLTNIFSSLPYIVDSHYSELFSRKMTQCIDEFEPDLVMCEWSPYAIFVRGLESVKKVIVAHNIESTIWKRYHETETSLLKKWYIVPQARKVDKFERDAFGWVDGATAVSADEAATIGTMAPELPVEVVDNGVDLEYFTGEKDREKPGKLVFVGSMDWRPNQDAVGYFVESIAPLLARDNPSLETTFVGRKPTEEIREYGNLEGITVTGTVDDVRPYIDEAAVYVVPLRVGGGSRLKILEALAMGKAVVSTSVGAEGLDLQDGRHLILADEPDSFSEAVSNLLSDEVRRRQLGEEGRKRVEERYGWDAISNVLEAFLEKLVGQS